MASEPESLNDNSESKGRRQREQDIQEESQSAKGSQSNKSSPSATPQHDRTEHGSADQPGSHFTGLPGGRPDIHRPAGMPEDADLTDAMVFLNRIKEEYADSLSVYDNFLETMRDFKFGKIDADEVCKAVRILFKDKPFLIHLFDEYLPQYLRYGERTAFEQRAAFEQPKFPQFRPGFPQSMPMNRMMGQAVPMQRGFVPRPKQPEGETPKQRLAEDFIHLVKKHYTADPSVYKQFVELLQRSRDSFSKLLGEVSLLFSDAPELIELFERNFRPATSDSGQAADPLRAIKEALAQRNLLEDFLKILNFYNQNYISAHDLVALIKPLIPDQGALDAFKSFIRYEEQGFGNGYATVDGRAGQVGSYRLLAQPVQLGPAVCEVVNNLCISVSTHESEEDTYVFRNKNSSEELLVRVSDERSESDLLLRRLKYLICRLDEAHATQPEKLELDGIHMSAALVKETLRQIYEGKSREVLEALLDNPAKAIPIVLRRLYSVYRENLAVHRQHRRAWRELVQEHYYKAYDTRGVAFRAGERKFLTLRHIHSIADTPLVLERPTSELISLLRHLFSLFIANPMAVPQRKYPSERLMACFDTTLGRILGDGVANGNEPKNAAEASQLDTNTSIDLTVDFDLYAFALYFCTLWSRFAELRSLNGPPLTSSPMAVRLGLQDEFCITDRYSGVLAAAEALAARDIDAEQFEERVRFLTDSTGYKLYNLKRILSKLEKLTVQLISSEEGEAEPLFPGEYSVSCTAEAITLRALDRGTEQPVEEDE